MTILAKDALTEFAFPDERQRWDLIRTYALDDPKAEEPLSFRLAEEQGWTIEFTRRAMEEYLRFCFLAVTIGECTPSLKVDKVWHIHLQYTEEYWEDFCPNFLGRDLHHHPGTGNKKDEARFREVFQKTIGYYQTYFGSAPPAEIW